MKKTYYSNGKLLITGEYLVLNGAKAFALPTKFGQFLEVNSSVDKTIKWKSFDVDKSLWLESSITFDTIITNNKNENDDSQTNKLIEILHQAYLLNPKYITKSKGYLITTELTFSRNWGLGTLSTLINNIAQWLEINPYILLQKTFGGSGYDIACAQNDSALLYQMNFDILSEKPLIKKLDFNPTFKENLFFVYLNNKQNSSDSISNYFNKSIDFHDVIPVIDAITSDVINALDVKSFALALQKHEIELSNVLEMQTIQEKLFPDFKGVIKSLGAWNGDFVLSISKENPTSYFNKNGFPVVIPYSEMIL